MSSLALVSVGYNRVHSISRLLNSLNNADYLGDDIDLYISLDKANTNDVVDYATSFEWHHGNKKVLTYPNRLGLRKHILKCGELLEQYDAIAILEDDLVVSDGFYNYMKQAVQFYKDNDQVAGISLYANKWNEFACSPFLPMHSEYDAYFFQFAESRGQIWLKKQWKAFMQWYENGNNGPFISDNLPEAMCRWPETSWKKYHVKYCVDNNLYFVYPYVSFATCFSDIGTHTNRIDTFIQTELYHGATRKFSFPAITDKEAVYYDVFYERINLLGYLDCEFDLYGIKPNVTRKRYLISSRNLPYRLICSFGVQMKPQEENILLNVEGNEFYKYDTSIHDTQNVTNNKLAIFRYRFDMYDHSKELLACVVDSLRQCVRRILMHK